MPVTVERGRFIQAGKQVTFDTPAAATFKYPGALTFTEEVDLYEPPYPQGVRAMTAGQLVLNRQGFSGQWVSELTPEELLLFANACVRGGTAPAAAVSGTANAAVTATGTTLVDTRLAMTPNLYVGMVVTCATSTLVVTSNTATTFTGTAWVGGTPANGLAWTLGGSLWTFSPPTAGDPVPGYVTLEFATNDFTTQYGRRVPNVLVPKFGLHFGINSPATLTVDMFGGFVTAPQAPTAALANLPAREVLRGNSTKVYIDNTGAGIGATQVSGAVISADIEIIGGLRPDYTLEGRPNLDYSKYLFGDAMATLKMTMEYTSDANAEIANWRSKTKRFIRVLSVGSNSRKVQWDGCIEYVAKPTIAAQNGNDIVTFTAVTKYDPTWANIYSLFVSCAQATIT